MGIAWYVMLVDCIFSLDSQEKLKQYMALTVPRWTP